MIALSRRERERQMRREAMLEAARAVFAEKGYTRATLDEIAHRAEFGKGTLYNYFQGGKEALLFAIFDDLYDEFHRITVDGFTPEQIDGRPFREVLERYIESSLTFFWEDRDLFMILIKETYRMTFSEDETKADYFMRQHERMIRALMEPIQAAIGRGAMRPLPPRAVAHMILGSIEGVMMHMCFQDMKEEAPVGCVADAPPTPAESATFLTSMLYDGIGPSAQASSVNATSTPTFDSSHATTSK